MKKGVFCTNDKPKAEIGIPLRQMPFGKVFAIKDPDGQLRFLLEFAKDRPSQPAK
jgi:hypothetical protein